MEWLDWNWKWWNKTGIWVNFTVGDTCTATNKDNYPNYTTKYKITCDKNQKSENIYEIMNNLKILILINV